MTPEAASTIVDMIDGHYKMYLHQNEPARTMWMRFMESWEDVDMVMKAVVEWVSRETKQPMIADIRQTIKRLEVDARMARPAIERWTHDASIPAWVKGWVIARYRHQDMRVWPQQKDGYDSLQTANPRSKAYIWPKQTPMPEADQLRYQDEGKDLTGAAVARIIAVGT